MRTWQGWVAVLVAFGSLFLLFSLEGNAQTACGDRTAIIAKLYERYNEVRVYQSLSNDGAVIELFVQQEGEQRTWTLLRTDPAGMSCLMGAGSYIQFLSDRFPGPSERT